MGAQLRLIRRRIRSVKSTAKITRAQELIASSRIIKAQERVRASGPYAREITRAVSAVISHDVRIDHPLLTPRTDTNRVAVLLITSDRGFCGGYNANVLREGEALMTLLRDEGKEPIPYIVGRKGITWYTFRQREMAGQWSGFTDNPTFANAEEIGRVLVGAFRAPAAEAGVAEPGTGDERGAAGRGHGGEPDVAEIHVVYTEFISMLTQRVEVRRVVPLEIEEADETSAESGGPQPSYDFEPSPEGVLDQLLPNYIESRIWHMLLQAAASEHASRRRAMKSATDNANELMDVLTRQANQARQAEITQEISEIVGGANALAEASAGSE